MTTTTQDGHSWKFLLLFLGLPAMPCCAWRWTWRNKYFAELQLSGTVSGTVHDGWVTRRRKHQIRDRVTLQCWKINAKWKGKIRDSGITLLEKLLQSEREKYKRERHYRAGRIIARWKDKIQERMTLHCWKNIARWKGTIQEREWHYTVGRIIARWKDTIQGRMTLHCWKNYCKVKGYNTRERVTLHCWKSYCKV